MVISVPWFPPNNFETWYDYNIHCTEDTVERQMEQYQCDQEKSPNVHKNCPKMTSLEKLRILTP